MGRVCGKDFVEQLRGVAQWKVIEDESGDWRWFAGSLAYLWKEEKVETCITFNSWISISGNSDSDKVLRSNVLFKTM